MFKYFFFGGGGGAGGEFGPGSSILSYEAGFFFSIPPSLASLIYTGFLFQVFDPNKWCLKNGLLTGGLNPRPLSHESSAVTTRPRLLAMVMFKYILIHFHKL